MTEGDSAGRPGEPSPGRRRARILLVCAATFVAVFVAMKLFPAPQHERTVNYYLAAAKNLADGEGLQKASGVPYAAKPPLLPVLLAGLHLIGVGWWTSICLINALFFVIGLAAIHELALALGLRRGWPVVAFYLVLAPLNHLVLSAEPDLAFTSASLAAVALAVRYYRSTGAPSALVGAAAFSAVAALSRYLAMFTVIPFLALAIAVFPKPTWTARLRHVGAYLCLALLPIGLWMLRNQLVTGFLSGMERSHPRRLQLAGATTLGANFENLFRTFYIDFLGWPAIARASYVKGVSPLENEPVTLSLLGLAVAAVALVAIAARRPARPAPAAAPRSDPGRAAALALVGGYLFLYPAVLIVLWTVGNNDIIQTQYVTPAYPFVLLAVGVGIAALERARPARSTRLVLVAVGALAFAGQAAKTVWNWQEPTLRKALYWSDGREEPEAVRSAANDPPRPRREGKRIAPR